MGAACKENCPQICQYFDTSTETNNNQDQIIESKLRELGEFIGEDEFNEKIPEQVRNYRTKKQFSIPNNLNISDKVYQKAPLKFNNNNDIYKGNWNENSEKHGYGEYYIETEKKFIEGVWKNNNLVYGKIFYPNNNKYDIYKGFINNFLPDGEGKISFSTGDKYEGDFREGRKEGTGKYTFYDKTVYKGNFVNNKFDGEGTIEWTNNIKYEGGFSQGYFNNHGKLFDKDNDGEKYEGNFQNNFFDGEGKYTFEDGSTYEGSFTLNMRNGRGVFIKKNNEFKYEGNWVDDFPNGSGTFTKGNIIIKGTWKYSSIEAISESNAQNNEFNRDDLNFSSQIPEINLIPNRLPHMKRN